MQDSTQSVAWPQKTRELQTVILDSTRWNGFPFRDDDIVIVTWGKAGTTWMQQIVAQFIFGGAEGIPAADLSPFVDLACLPPLAELRAMLEAQQHRRFLKTHLPVDALAFSPQAKYIYIGRDGRDMLWSWHHHHSIFTEQAYEMMNNAPGRVGPPLAPPNPDVVQYFRDWLENDGAPFQPFWSHVQGWWNIRHLPNVLLVHFNNLKADLEDEMRRLADFLGFEFAETVWPTLVEHCTFDYMKKNASALSKMWDLAFQGGGQSFIHKGTNGRWRDVLPQADIQNYERAARANLTDDCARWLATGEM